MEKFWAASFTLFLIMMATFNMTASSIFYEQLDDVNNILYAHVNIMAKEGEVTPEVLNVLEAQLDKYGPYELTIISKSYANGLELSGSDLIGVNLRREGYEYLTVSVKYLRPHIFSFFVNRNYFGHKIGNSEINLFGTVQTYVR